MNADKHRYLICYLSAKNAEDEKSVRTFIYVFVLFAFFAFFAFLADHYS